MLNIAIAALACLGVIHALRFARSVFRFLALHLVPSSHPLRSYKRASGDAYALVTGSSAGIGLGIAQELVRQGFCVTLLGHLPDELAESAERLRGLRPGAKVKTLVLNAQTASREAIEEAVKSIADLEVTILVNNVGGNPISPPMIRQLSTYSPEDVDAVLDLNVRFMSQLTALMIPIMSRRERAAPGERSLIIVVSSGARYGLPWLVMYAASKAFGLIFGVSLARELRADPETAHIDSLVVVPGDVRSHSNVEGVAAHEPGWEEFGRSVVSKTDRALRQGRMEVRPHWRHDIRISGLEALSEGMRTKAFLDVMTPKRDTWRKFHEKTQ
ncbi:NAD(P)-binding protein [Thozetella sp. PMI_491]|nr:NAD(P)-binding protein [Thozetella sp. PMI_491]